MEKGKKKTRKSTSNTVIQDLILNLSDKLDSVGVLVTSIDKKVDLHRQESAYKFKSLEDLDSKQNEILQEHHDRSNQLKKDNELREAALRADLEKVENRVIALEEPRKWWRQTWGYLFAIGGALALILEVIKYGLELFRHT